MSCYFVRFKRIPFICDVISGYVMFQLVAITRSWKKSPRAHGERFIATFASWYLCLVYCGSTLLKGLWKYFGYIFYIIIHKTITTLLYWNVLFSFAHAHLLFLETETIYLQFPVLLIKIRLGWSNINAKIAHKPVRA